MKKAKPTVPQYESSFSATKSGPFPSYATTRLAAKYVVVSTPTRIMATAKMKHFEKRSILLTQTRGVYRIQIPRPKTQRGDVCPAQAPKVD